jgi:glycosyltransferase involved in cell wall biosynthesis
MKKILFAIPTLGGGGAERVLINLVNNLDKRKYQITVFTLFNFGVNRDYLKGDINYISFFNNVFRGNIHLLKLLSPEGLFMLMIKDEFDLVVSYLEGPTTRIISGCPFSKTKLINWIHTEIHDRHLLIKPYRNYKEMVKSYKRYNETIFVSNTAKIAFNEVFPEIDINQKVIYNTIDYNNIIINANEIIKDCQIDNSKLNLVSVGRYTHLKGYKRLIKIIRSLVDQKINLHLYLIGSGELEVEYTRLIKELNLEKFVTLLGFKGNPYKYVKNCDLFICSSYSEGFSTAVTEALIVGTPVITTLCSGMQELLGYDDEYGIITENKDEALMEGIKKLVDDPNLIEKYRKQALIRGRQLCNDNNTKEVEILFDRLLES